MKTKKWTAFFLMAILSVGFMACSNDDDDENIPVTNETEEEEEIDKSFDPNFYSGEVNGHKYVDLGLSVMWATCNVGVTYPSECGNYYAWGETKVQEQESGQYAYFNYKWNDGYSVRMTKYCTDSEYGIVDNRTILEASDDVATIEWGNYWRIPTKEEFEELRDKCKWVFITHSGQNGYKVVGPNGNCIFLPLTGFRYLGITDNYAFGNYWSSALDKDNNCGAYILRISFEEYTLGSYTRWYGICVRSVTTLEQISLPESGQSSSTLNGHEYVDLGLSVKWATCNVGASKAEDYGDYYAWGETATKSNYDWDTYKWCRGTEDSMTKYCTSSSYGTVDNKTVLDRSDDVATVKWGSSWRMPTEDEMDELVTKCIWKWEKRNGVNGYLVTGPNGKSIYLPASGFYEDDELYDSGEGSIYWTSTLQPGDSSGAVYLDMTYGTHNVNYGWERYSGCPVRPVTK